eukprot:TRINITY_DN6041_c0_g1_i1.p1 TRINITY_DN6041_c0_g1~~TRINITY_DN6041_c0_g1_i1.p1  ORF type:complete len:765 (-),score=209.10 TRINITY_DN6041_c0_g1_i1:573-2867(-)
MNFQLVRNFGSTVKISRHSLSSIRLVHTSVIMAKRSQPAWSPPTPEEELPSLHLFNSLTRKKEKFIPQAGKRVTWYNCGPTVYDASHMGHARTYLSFDILRRVMQNYFGYDIFYVMNITDIDDKIIKRARQNHLYENYVKSSPSLEKVLDDCNKVVEYFGGKVEKTTDPDKKVMQEKMFEKLKLAVANVESAVASGDAQKIDAEKEALLRDAKDVMSDWLDTSLGSTVTENSIFADLPRFWEEEFHKDMEALNVMSADCLTRVSEYVPEIVQYIQQIIERNYAYESKGSVYFDVKQFDSSPCHHYAKCVPEAFGDTSALAEGEGDLSADGQEKRSPNDFALWKASKPGEPSWPSPWGAGRPGWHIECSVMASAILGNSMDIHSGGYDLKFPHHDNELAQSEAYYDNDTWVRYFLHSGHLTIAGCKMSKSLKNFITIQEVLQKFSARQVRILFLLHSWKDTLDYNENTMELAKSYEKTASEFFLTVRHYLRSTPGTGVAAFSKWTPLEVDLNNSLAKCQANVHAAFCDNIDTRTVLESLKELITHSNAYTKEVASNVNRQLLRNVAVYITKIFDVLGMIKVDESVGFPSSSSAGAGADLETLVLPYLTSLAEFRDNVRKSATEIKATEILMECDRLRDDVLPNLGVRLEDKKEEATVIKLVDREELMKERAEKKAAEEKKRLEKEARKAEAAAKAAALEAAKRMPPSEMFKGETDKYSAWDDKGFPTLTKDGQEIPKAQVKKLQKAYAAQEKKYSEWLKSQDKEP